MSSSSTTSATPGSSGSAPIRDTVSDFAAATRLTDVPPPVREFSALLLLDTLGALAGGLRYPPVQALGALLADTEVESKSAPFARLMTLGAAATWLDSDSGGSFHPQGHRLPPVPTAHPAPHVLPILLHEAADHDIDDLRLLEVFTIATELGMRSGRASSLRPGLHPHGVHGPGAAGVAAALLRGLPSDLLGHAFLLGSTLPLAATLDVPVHGGTVRNAWTGLGTYYGASAVDQIIAGARTDDVAYRKIFDGAVCTDLDVDLLIGGLGQRWTLLESYLKPYACARWIHPALDAARAAMADLSPAPSTGDPAPDAASARETDRLRADEVESITVETFAFAASLSEADIGSDMQARFSLPYSLAALLVDGVLDAGSYLPERLRRDDVAALARRVTLHERSEMTAALPSERPATVTLRLRDGRRVRGHVSTARGNPSDPLSTDETVAKFRGNVGDRLQPGMTDQVVVAVLEAGSSTASSTSTPSRALAAAARVLLRG
ncbi:MAG: MmgE/PrpD family protein [Terracoccus sp.]